MRDSSGIIHLLVEGLLVGWFTITQHYQAIYLYLVALMLKFNVLSSFNVAYAHLSLLVRGNKGGYAQKSKFNARVFDEYAYFSPFMLTIQVL